MDYLIIAIIAYLIGSISFSVIFCKKYAGIDPRDVGSGNAGTTNVLRNAGFKVALITAVADVLKGTVAVLIPYLYGLIFKIDYSANLIMIATIFSIIGHTFPIFFGFRGGKGVATFVGALLFINPMIAGILIFSGVLVVLLTKKMSVASLLVAIMLPVLMIFLSKYNTVEGSNIYYVMFSAVISAGIILNHRENIKRLASGTESNII